MSTSEPTPEEEAAARAKEGDDDFLTAYCLAAEQAALPYKWTQTLEYVDLVIPFPAGTRARELAVTMTKKKLSVGLKGKNPIISVCVTRILPTNTCRASFTRRSRWMTALGLLVRSTLLLLLTNRGSKGSQYAPRKTKGNGMVASRRDFSPQNRRHKDST